MPTDIIEMFWGCLVCNAENKGRYKICQNCGKPRSENSPEWMPEDISPMAAVKDVKLLSKFSAGADWKCRYCDSSQYRADGCCAQCGSDQKESEQIFDKLTVVVNDDSDLIEQNVLQTSISLPLTDYGLGFLKAQSKFRAKFPIKKFVLGIVISVLCGFLLYFVFRTKVVNATVTSTTWERTISVERYQVFSKEGWTPGFGSFDVHNDGSRIHHYDHVRVGSHQESYQESYQCGENCTTVRGSCYTTSRSCTSNRNGSATCTGGDRVCSPDTRSCSPKYCSRTKQRTIDDYQDQPRYQTWYSWKVWDWGFNRNVKTTGSTEPLFWPSNEQVHLNVGINYGEKERESARKESFLIRFSDQKESYNYEPKTENEFLQFKIGNKHKLKVGIANGVEVLPSSQADY